MALFLVTGGAGFIGSHIAERLLHDGQRVRVLDNLSTGRRENLDVLRAAGGAAFEWLEGDIRDRETCARACRGVEVVFHEAALASVQRSIENPSASTAVNVLGSVHVLEAARAEGVRRVICASSSSVYGDSPVLPKHEGLPLAPLSPYAASKLAMEQSARVWSVTLGLPTISLRYFNVFGPRQDPRSDYAAVIPRFIRALLEGKPPVIFGDGRQSRDFTYVDNVVQANLEAATRGDGRGEAVNVACGGQFTLLALLDTLAGILRVRPSPEFLPARAGDVRHSLASIECAQGMLGYQPRVGFEEGLRRTVAHFQGEPNAPGL